MTAQRRVGGPLASVASTALEAAERSGREEFAQYQYYNSTLRAWLIGFGAGVPIVVLNSDKLVDHLNDHRWIALVHLAGVLAQIFGATLNKYTNYFEYSECTYGRGQEEEWGRRYERFLVQLNQPKYMIVDVLIDLVSLLLFAVASFAGAYWLLDG